MAAVVVAAVGLVGLPALPAAADPLDCLLEATGTVSVTPWPEVALGAPVEVDWSASAKCAISVQVSGPGFGATERLAKSGSRQVTPLPVTGVQRWTLHVSVGGAGTSDVDFDQVHVRGPVTSAMASAAQLGGVVHVFEATASGGLRMRWQRTPGIDDWTAWSALDAPAGKLLQNVAAAANSDGRIELFAVDRDGVVYHRYQTSNISEAWSGWEASFGTDVVGMALTRMADGRLVIFASTADGQLSVRWENGRNTSATWGSWVVLGNNGVNLRGLAAGTDKDGHLELWALDAAGNIYQKWQASPQSDPSAAWGGFGVVPGGLNTIALASNVDGRLEVFGTNTSAGVYHNAQLAANGTTGWTGWQQFNGGLFSLTVTPNYDGRIELSGLGGGGFYWHRWQFDNSVAALGVSYGGWSEWQLFSDNPDGHPAYDPVACTNHVIMCQVADVNGDGSLDAVAFVDSDPSNNGWQGRALVALGVKSTTNQPAFQPWTVWATTGCDGPGEDCQFATMNRDRAADLVEFVKDAGASTRTGADGGDVLVYISGTDRPNPNQFHAAQKWADWFCPGAMLCRLGDVTGDGLADAVGFIRSALTDSQEGDVWVMRNTVNGFGFAAQEKWSDRACVLSEDCQVGDVNGDGRADVVAFVKSTRGGTDTGDAYVALSTGTAFGATAKWSDNICVGNEICSLADVDKDGRADAVAKYPKDTTMTISQARVALANATGTAFQSAVVMDLNLTAAGGARRTNEPISVCQAHQAAAQTYQSLATVFHTMSRSVIEGMSSDLTQEERDNDITRNEELLEQYEKYSDKARDEKDAALEAGCG